jgi:hypothetical protein
MAKDTKERILMAALDIASGVLLLSFVPWTFLIQTVALERYACIRNSGE